MKCILAHFVRTRAEHMKAKWGTKGWDTLMVKWEALQSCFHHGQEFGSAVALGVTHAGSCAGTSWAQRGLDSKLQITSMHLEHGVTHQLHLI